jgi:hypothetical protein
MQTTNVDLTIEICSEDGSRTQFYQNDEDSISEILRLLITPRLFTRPILILASERSVSTVPCQTIDVIMVRTPATLPLLLPPGWMDVVEVSEEALHDEAIFSTVENTDGEGLPKEEEGAISRVEIHTFGGWMFVPRLQTVMQKTIQDQRQTLAHFFDLPVISFRLETGGVGFINPAKIGRVPAYPAFKGVAETALPADLLRWTPAFQRK